MKLLSVITLLAALGCVEASAFEYLQTERDDVSVIAYTHRTSNSVERTWTSSRDSETRTDSGNSTTTGAILRHENLDIRFSMDKDDEFGDEKSFGLGIYIQKDTRRAYFSVSRELQDDDAYRDSTTLGLSVGKVPSKDIAAEGTFTVTLYDDELDNTGRDLFTFSGAVSKELDPKISLHCGAFASVGTSGENNGTDIGGTVATGIDSTIALAITKNLDIALTAQLVRARSTMVLGYTEIDYEAVGTSLGIALVGKF